MSTARKVVLPPPYETSSEQLLRGDHAIYNKLLHKENLGWSPDAVASVGNFVKVLSDCLWTLDPHHEQWHVIYHPFSLNLKDSMIG